MLWKIRHDTFYNYSAPVLLGPHVIRLRPISDAYQRLIHFDLQVEPAPVSRADNVDIDGNDVVQLWFDQPTESFQIRTEATVETLRHNPFDYLWDGIKTLPVRYAEELRAPLAHYCGDRALGRVGELADAAAVAAGGDAQAFPMELTLAIHRACRQIYREEGAPLPGAETLRLGEGSCRDLAQVFLEASRAKGYAARFVSGYVSSGAPGDQELHAWAELYLPGGGWRGFDPTRGMAASDHHVVLARAATPILAAPLSGHFRGRGTATLTAEVSVEAAVGA